MTRPLILTGVQIDAILWRYLDGELRADQVPMPLLSWYWAGMREPDDAIAREVRMLHHDVNYWYNRATNPRQHERLMAGILADHAQAAAKSAQRARWAALDKAEKDRQADLDARAVARG